MSKEGYKSYTRLLMTLMNLEQARLDSNSQTTNPTLESEERMSSNGVCYK